MAEALEAHSLDVDLAQTRELGYDADKDLARYCTWIPEKWTGVKDGGIDWKMRKAWFFRLPLFQFAALFWYSTPRFEEVRDGLTTLGVIAALLLSLMLALPGSLAYSDYSDANARFNYNSSDLALPDYSLYAIYWNTTCTGMSGAGTYPISDIFLRLSMITVATLLTSVLLACVIYFHIVFGEATGTNNQVSMARREFEWWRWSKYPIVVLVGCLVTGTVVFFITVWVYILIRVPDQTLEPANAGIYPRGVNALKVGYQGIYTWSFWVFVVLLIIVLLGMWAMGFAQFRTMELPEMESKLEQGRRSAGNKQRHDDLEDDNEKLHKEERLLKLLLSFYEHRFETLGVKSKYEFEKVAVEDYTNKKKKQP